MDWIFIAVIIASAVLGGAMDKKAKGRSGKSAGRQQGTNPPAAKPLYPTAPKGPAFMSDKPEPEYLSGDDYPQEEIKPWYPGASPARETAGAESGRRMSGANPARGMSGTGAGHVLPGTKKTRHEGPKLPFEHKLFEREPAKILQNSSTSQTVSDAVIAENVNRQVAARLKAESPVHREKLDIDPKKLVIYTAIMNPKYEEM